jgi:hypothetical protein
VTQPTKEVLRTRLHLLVGVSIVWLATIGLMLLVRTYYPSGPLIALVAATSIFAMVAAIFVVAPMHAFLRTLPTNYLVVFGGIFAAVLVGHNVHQKRALFPFIDWGMFTQAQQKNEVIFHEYEAILANGEQVTLNPVRVVPALNKQRLFVAFTRFGEFVHEGHTSAGQNEVYDGVLKSIARKYNEQHDEPVVRIRVVRNVLTLNQQMQQQIERERVREIAIIEEGSR